MGKQEVRFTLDKTEKIVEVGMFSSQFGGNMVDHMTFGPLRVEEDEDVAVDWVKRTARVVKKEA